MKFDLAWGNSVAVRQAFLANASGVRMVFDTEELLKFDYPDHAGDPKLVEITRKVIERQTGLNYRHILLTNGATGGVVISLRALAAQGRIYCNTRNAPFYVRYPKMIEAAGLVHSQEIRPITKHASVVLLDIPSNPLGLTTTFDYNQIDVPVVLDGVYLNRVYTNGSVLAPAHDVMIGSYSKLLGINGIRIGWIATNDSFLFERMSELVTSEYCGLSTASTEIVKQALHRFNWHNFEVEARQKLDHNREEWSKMERYFGQTPVIPVGMFYYGPVDRKAKELLTKAGIHYTTGDKLGTDDSFGRFNLGQDNDLTRKAVRAMLKADKI